MAAEGIGDSVTERDLVKSSVLREAFNHARKDIRDTSISDADFELTYQMTRDEMRACIMDYERRCIAWELIDAIGKTPVVPLDGYKKKPISAKLRWAVFKRDQYRCVLCGSEEDLAADHIFSEALGGETTLENLQTLCRRCNSKKGIG